MGRDGARMKKDRGTRGWFVSETRKEKISEEESEFRLEEKERTWIDHAKC